MIQTGYRIAMLVSGAGALVIASRFGWFAAYATMAALLTVGILVFLFGPEPKPAAEPLRHSRTDGRGGLGQWLATAVTGPFAEFMRRPLWLVILLHCRLQTGRGAGGRNGNTPLCLARFFT